MSSLIISPIAASAQTYGDNLKNFKILIMKIKSLDYQSIRLAINLYDIYHIFIKNKKDTYLNNRNKVS